MASAARTVARDARAGGREEPREIAGKFRPRRGAAQPAKRSGSGSAAPARRTSVSVRLIARAPDALHVIGAPREQARTPVPSRAQGKHETDEVSECEDRWHAVH